MLTRWYFVCPTVVYRWPRPEEWQQAAAHPAASVPLQQLLKDRGADDHNMWETRLFWLKLSFHAVAITAAQMRYIVINMEANKISQSKSPLLVSALFCHVFKPVLWKPLCQVTGCLLWLWQVKRNLPSSGARPLSSQAEGSRAGQSSRRWSSSSRSSACLARRSSSSSSCPTACLVERPDPSRLTPGSALWRRNLPKKTARQMTRGLYI